MAFYGLGSSTGTALKLLTGPVYCESSSRIVDNSIIMLGFNLLVLHNTRTEVYISQLVWDNYLGL